MFFIPKIGTDVIIKSKHRFDGVLPVGSIAQVQDVMNYRFGVFRIKLNGEWYDSDSLKIPRRVA